VHIETIRGRVLGIEIVGVGKAISVVAKVIVSTNKLLVFV
jgi:hypothetical protein